MIAPMFWRSAAEMKTAEADIISGKLKPFSGPFKDQAGTEKVAAGASLPDSEIRGMTWLVDGVQGTLPKM
jgi:basic membrane protein A and related proteins